MTKYLSDNSGEAKPGLTSKNNSSSAGGGSNTMDTYIEHTDKKKRRCRRGKKRRRHTEVQGLVRPFLKYRCEKWDSPSDNEVADDQAARYSPKAPENYTQFLLSDQNDNLVEEANAYEGDLMRFLKNQFESDYRQQRTAELECKSKTELLAIIHELENKKTKLVKSRSDCSICCSSSEVGVPASNESDSFEGNSSSSSQSCTDESEFDSVAMPCSHRALPLYEQYVKLQKENARLQKLNERLATSWNAL